jgi:glycosyltransferase involved in cell wall biosynthesis
MKNNQGFKISLIICAYNEEKYLGDCLDCAIQNSNGKFFEILVIDNASTDNTKLIAEKRSGVRVVREEKKGLTRARQRGHEEAQGDILVYIDADTKMPEGWFERVIREFEGNRDLVCLSGPYIYYDTSKFKQLLVRVYWLFAVPVYWVVGYMVVGGNFVIKKETLEKMNGFDTLIEFYGEDTNIARRASQFGKVKFMLSHYMYTSGRRLEKQGILSTFKEYMFNFLSEVFLHKPVTKEYKDLR